MVDSTHPVFPVRRVALLILALEAADLLDI
jgi:hypothetical protein